MRCLLKHFGIVLLAVFVLSMAADVAVAQQQGMVPGQSAGAVNDSELWRSIRNGAEGLIQSEGDNWRALRNGPVSTWGGYLMGLMV
ncbi:MAG: hypothetical protein HOK06_08720, partial [Rhodospirillaceae bacterium]|nr:hypothetical protein [Rhodospirillaceae bacterium]